MCTVHQEQNHGICLTEKRVWRWRPYVNCIIVNKLNLVKPPSACLCLICVSFLKKNPTIYINIGAGVSGNVEYQESFFWFQFWGFWQLFEKPCCTLLSSAKILDPLLLSTFSTTEYAVRFSYYPDWHFWLVNEAWMCNGWSQKMIRMWPKSCLKHTHFSGLKIQDGS